MRLRCTQGPLRGQIIELETTRPMVMGRQAQGAVGVAILLDSRSVSRKHCQIEYDGKSFRIKDLQSSNGIRVNRQKVLDAFLSRGDQLQVGEFTFVVEDEPAALTETELEEGTPAASFRSTTEEPQPHELPSKSRVDSLKNLGRGIWGRFEKIEFIYKVALILAVGGVVSHWISSFAIVSESSYSLIQQSFDVGRQSLRNLAERNRASLAAESAVSLDCTFIRDVPGVERAYVLNKNGKSLCPVGAPQFDDDLYQLVLELKEPLNNCEYRIFTNNEGHCDFMGPVFDWDQNLQAPTVVGYVRLEFAPDRAFETVQNLQTLSLKTLLFTLAIMFAIWMLIRLWLRRAVEMATDNVHVVTTGSAQNIEKIESFASLDPLIEEFNRQIIKSSQGVSQASRDVQSEASFLQNLLQQILLLEERAVLAVDSENQLLAASSSLTNVVPIDLSSERAHITEIIGDTHLQGELMAFLNDLSSSESVQDRALSMADRILQVRGVPLFLKNNHVASLLIF